LKKLKKIWLYVWLGTCDLTTKNKKYVALTHDDDRAIEYAIDYLGKIKELIKEHPGCIVTFLEIPVYSIQEWNKKAGHKTPENFAEQDSKLEQQVYKFNARIRDLNKDTNVFSPLFGTDLVKTSKTVKNKKTGKSIVRKTNNFKLYKD
jgi:hypothetical protein